MACWRYLRSQFASGILPSLVLLIMTSNPMHAALRQTGPASADMVLSHTPDAIRTYDIRMEAATIGLIGSAAWLLGVRLRRKISEPS